MHKHLPLAALALMLCAAPALAQQSPNTTPTTVTRVVLINIKGGHIRLSTCMICAQSFDARAISFNYDI